MDKPVGRNWWKIGFFVLLFLLEVAREIIIIANDAEARPLVGERFFSYDGSASATGTWKRTDGGEPLNKAAVSIRCDRDRGECYEAAYNIDGLNVFEPSINIHPAVFSDKEITFTDDSSLCMSYSTRLDLASEKVTRVRLKKVLRGDEPRLPPDWKELCDTSEARIEMGLSGYSAKDNLADPSEEHFLPVLRFARWVSNAL